MAFKNALKKSLKIEKELEEFLPSGIQILGQIGILNLKKEVLPLKKKIAQAVMEEIPRLKTICMYSGAVSGKYRKPKVEYISGEKKFEAIHTEQECKFLFDVRKIMWSKGNIAERQRIAEVVKEGEVVIDFFAGIGYWSIPIAKHSKAKKIYAIEMNPSAFKYLKKNIELNKAEERIEAVKGDCTKKALELEEADRIILGILPSAKFALPTALKKIKTGGILHYEGIAEERKETQLFKEVEEEALKQGKNATLLKAQKVKSFSPHKNHYTLDVEIT